MTTLLIPDSRQPFEPWKKETTRSSFHKQRDNHLSHNRFAYTQRHWMDSKKNAANAMNGSIQAQLPEECKLYVEEIASFIATATGGILQLGSNSAYAFQQFPSNGEQVFCVRRHEETKSKLRRFTTLSQALENPLFSKLLDVDVIISLADTVDSYTTSLETLRKKLGTKIQCLMIISSSLALMPLRMELGAYWTLDDRGTREGTMCSLYTLKTNDEQKSDV
jgi:hypothetical protein